LTATFLFSFMFDLAWIWGRRQQNVEAKSIAGYRGVAITRGPRAFFRGSELGKVQNFPVHMKLDQ